MQLVFTRVKTAEVHPLGKSSSHPVHKSTTGGISTVAFSPSTTNALDLQKQPTAEAKL